MSHTCHVPERAIFRLGLHTVHVVPLDKPAASLSHHHAVRVAVTDVVVSQDGVSTSTDVHPPPLVLFDHVLWKRKASMGSQCFCCLCV